MWDLKFKEAERFEKNWSAEIGSLRTPALRSAVQAFNQNILDLEWLVGVVRFAAAFGRWEGQVWANASQNILGDATPLEHCGEHAPAIRAEAFRIVASQTRPEPMPSFAYMTDLVGHITNSQSPELQGGFRAILTAQTIGAWTTFETLATDLWITALNERPTTFGERALQAQRYDKDRPEVLTAADVAEDVETRQKSPKYIKLDVLRRHGYDLSKSMGDMLYRSRQFPLDRLNGIRHAYQVAFGAAANDVFTKYGELRILEAVRNLLVHKAGIVDQQFLDRVKSYPALQALELKSRFPIDGRLSGQLTDTAVKAGVDLIRFVDGALADKSSEGGKDNGDESGDEEHSGA